MPEDDPDRLDAWLYDAGEVGWPGEIEFYRSVHPLDGSRWRMASQWRLDRDRADAILTRAWQRLDASDRPIDEVDEEPMRLHIFTVDEVRSAVEAAGLRTLAVFGDFDQSPFTPASSSIVYVVERPGAPRDRGCQ